MYTYKLHLHKEDDGGYTVIVPTLPGCITYGKDVEEAVEMAKEAIALYIEELQERGESIPDDHFGVEDLRAFARVQANLGTSDVSWTYERLQEFKQTSERPT